MDASAPPLPTSLSAEASKLGGTPLLPSSLPLIDLGGMNGSCNVLLKGWAVGSPSDNGDDDDNNNNNNDNDGPNRDCG
jgi:hypothetical protein